MLTTRLPSSITKLKQVNSSSNSTAFIHPSNSLLKEKGKCLPFLDDYVETTDIGFETRVHHKPTFTDQYLRWEPFSPLKGKISLISTLVHQVLMICAKRRLNGEIVRIKKILLDDGYPKNVVNAQIAKKIAQFSILKRFGPEKCPVHLRVPWIATNLEKEIKTAVESCYGSVSIRLVFTSKRTLPMARKDVLPTSQKSFVIYEYKYHCDSRYVGQTSQPHKISVNSKNANCVVFVKIMVYLKRVRNNAVKPLHKKRNCLLRFK